jgi:NAD(P)-dependent dehydrogenase (short-subunit alcohol dehydrogenase family)
VVDEIRAAGGEAVANTDDVADWDGAERLVRTAVDSFGGLDVLVNNAGFLRDRMLANMSVDEWDAVIRVHLRGHFCPLRHAAGFWRDETKAGRMPDARIINTSSGAGLQGSIAQGAYSAAKAGMDGLMRGVAIEVASRGVTVNSVQPGFVATGSQTPEEHEIGHHTPIGRSGTAEEIGEVIAFLASDRARYVTGQTVVVDGGNVIQEAKGP